MLNEVFRLIVLAHAELVVDFRVDVLDIIAKELAAPQVRQVQASLGDERQGCTQARVGLQQLHAAVFLQDEVEAHIAVQPGVSDDLLGNGESLFVLLDAVSMTEY